MLLTQLGVRNFRNLKETRISTSSPCVVFTGVNGSGKTSFLEAIYTGVLLASFRTHKLDEIISFSKENSAVSLLFADEKQKRNIETFISRAGKEVFVDRVKVKKVDEGNLDLSVVPFVYEDKNIIKGEPKERRRFFDMFLSFTDKEYARNLRIYKNTLKERNASIKSGHKSLLGFYDMTLAESGYYIYSSRNAVLDEFSIFTNQIYTSLFGNSIDFSIDYKTDCNRINKKDDYLKNLEATRDKDLFYQSTTFGVHSDDFIFCSKGERASAYFSTGQIRLLSIIIRLAEIKFISNKSGTSPIILVDDVLLELDNTKKNAIFSYLTQVYPQVFWTFIKGDDFYKGKKDILVYNLENGEVVQDGS